MKNDAINSEFMPANLAADSLDVACRDTSTMTTKPAKSATRCRRTAPQEKAQHRTIAKLTRRIHEGYARVQSTFSASVLHAKRLGEDLQQLKNLVGHGNWRDVLSQLREACGIAQTTATLYMRIARDWQRIEQALEQDQLCDISLRRVQQFLSKPEMPALAPFVGPSVSRIVHVAGETLTSDGVASHVIAQDAGARGNVAAVLHDTENPIGLAPDNPCPAPVITNPRGDAAEWLTPPEIVQAALTTFSPDGITVDVAAEDAKERFNIPAELHYTKDIDGLAPDNAWTGSIFINPPHGNTDDEKWVDRLALEVQSGCVDEAIIVIPVRTDAACFDKLVQLSASFVFVRARHANPAPFPVLVAYVGHRHDPFALAFRELGAVLRPAEATWSLR